MLKHTPILRYALILSLCVLVVSSCEKNPVGSDEITLGTRLIKGQVDLNDNSNPKGTYVWLDGLDISTRTEPNGKFEIALPAAAAQTAPGGADGTFTLFYYMANYRLGSSEVIINDGEFVFAQADIDSRGRIKELPPLRKFLQISTAVTPATVQITYNRPIEIETTLESVATTTDVIFPKSVGTIMGACLIRNLNTGEIQIFETDFDLEFLEEPETFIRLKPGEPRKMHTEFTLTDMELSAGQYEVIPYFLLDGENVPTKLLASFGANLDELGPDYLKRPMQRNGGFLEITN